MQETPQAVPSHSAEPLALGGAQGVQVSPQAATSLGSRQVVPHGSVPAGQLPSQTTASSRQAPAHSREPVGQVGAQPVAVQVTSPPSGAVHASQLAPQ